MAVTQAQKAFGPRLASTADDAATADGTSTAESSRPKPIPLAADGADRTDNADVSAWSPTSGSTDSAAAGVGLWNTARSIYAPRPAAPPETRTKCNRLTASCRPETRWRRSLRRRAADDDVRPAAVQRPRKDPFAAAADDAADETLVGGDNGEPERRYAPDSGAAEPRQFAGADDARALPAPPRERSSAARGVQPSDYQPQVAYQANPDYPANEPNPSAGGPSGDNLFAGDDGPQSPPVEPAAPAVRNEGIGRPGAQQLEGSQSPSLVIEKTAPAEIQVGKPATFVITVRNTGQVVAQGVEIHDEIPQGTQLVGTKPAASQPAAGQLVWRWAPCSPDRRRPSKCNCSPSPKEKSAAWRPCIFAPRRRSARGPRGRPWRCTWPRRRRS